LSQLPSVTGNRRLGGWTRDREPSGTTCCGECETSEAYEVIRDLEEHCYRKWEVHLTQLYSKLRLPAVLTRFCKVTYNIRLRYSV